MKKNIAIITGGDSEEYNISLLSAKSVYQNLNKKKFNLYIIEFHKNNWILKSENGNVITSNNKFSLMIDNQEIRINNIFMAFMAHQLKMEKFKVFLIKEKSNTLAVILKYQVLHLINLNAIISSPN